MRFTRGAENFDVPRSGYLNLVSDLAFLHTYANDTWISVTGHDFPNRRIRMETAVGNLTRKTDDPRVQDVAVTQLNAYFEERTLIWPFGEEALEIRNTKSRNQSAALDQLLRALESNFSRQSPKRVSEGQHNVSDLQQVIRDAELANGDRRVREFRAELDLLKAENFDRLSNLQQRDEAARDVLRKSVDERISRFEEYASEAESKRRQEFDQQKLESIRWTEERQSELKALTNDMVTRAASLKEQADKWQADKDIEIKNANDANRISFATQKAHEYWATTKYNRHTRLAAKLFWVGCGYAGFVLGGTILFLIFGAKFFNQPIWQTPLAFALPLAVAVVALIWLGRILARTYMAHVQLAEDAQERGTMIETYVALIAAGVLDSSKVEEAQKTLFRPGSVGLLAGDSGMDTPIEVISKAISNQK